MRLQPALVWELARKDWKLFLADRQAALLCFLVPIVLASAFGAIFRHAGGSPRLTVFVVAADQSDFSHRTVTALRASEHLDARLVDRATALRRLSERTSGVALLLPPGFRPVLRRAGSDTGLSLPTVQVLHHPACEFEGRWVEGVLTEIVLREWAHDLETPMQQAGTTFRFERPFAVERQPLPGACSIAANTYSHSFCGMTLQYLLFWGMDSGLLWLRERRRGLWRRIRAAPLSLATLLAGKALSTAAVALAQIAVTFGFGWLVFGVRIEGSLVGFVLMGLAAALLSATTGLLVASLGGNEGRARSLSIVAILGLSLLGGLWMPGFLMPGWLQRLALAVPTTWAVRGFEGATWRGMDVRAAGRCALVVGAFSFAFLTLALWRLQRVETRFMHEDGA